jgi:hypothetical protein
VPAVKADQSPLPGKRRAGGFGVRLRALFVKPAGSSPAVMAPDAGRPTVQPERAEPQQAVEPEPEPELQRAAEPEPEPEPQRAAEPEPEPELLRAAEPLIDTLAALEAALDSLGQAHHRPYSRG